MIPKEITDMTVLAAQNGQDARPPDPAVTEEVVLVPGGNEELEALKVRLDLLAWLHAETAHQIKTIAVQQILNSPEVQEQLRQKLMEQIANT